MTSTTQQFETAPAAATAEPKPTGKSNVGKRARHSGVHLDRVGEKGQPSQNRRAARTRRPANLLHLGPRCLEGGDGPSRVRRLLAANPGNTGAGAALTLIAFEPSSIRKGDQRP